MTLQLRCVNEVISRPTTIDSGANRHVREDEQDDDRVREVVVVVSERGWASMVMLAMNARRAEIVKKHYNETS
jgi:hypothetical protein